MQPTFVIAGRITREFILPPVGEPLLDTAGGNALYAAAGLRVWEKEIGLLARVGEDYPRQWLKEISARGMDVSGIKILHQSLDLRSFIPYNEKFEIVSGTAVSQFARRGLAFPKSLLGYQSPADGREDAKKSSVFSPISIDIPSEYRDARAVHLCPMDFTSHNQLFSVFKAGLATVLTLDPSASYMTPAFFRDLRVIVSGLTAFMPSEEEMRSLFWGQTNDLWEMAAAVGEYGCEMVVIKCGALGQLVYEVPTKRKWQIPAYPSRMADPTGAGDAFCGGFLAGYKKTYEPLQAALYGNVSASLKVEGSGAFYPLDVMPGLAQARIVALKDLVREV